MIDFSVFQELTIGGVALAPIIVGLVALAKQYGLPTRHAPVLSAVLALAGYFLVLYLPNIPYGVEVAKVIASVAFTFVSTATVYKLQKVKR